MSAGGDIRMKGKGVFVESISSMNFKSASAMNIDSSGKASVRGSSVSLTGSSIDVDGTLNVKSGTNLKATGTDSRGDSHNLSVNGSGASSAATAAGAGLTGGGESPAAADLTAATEANQVIQPTVAATAAIAESAAAVSQSITSAAQGLLNATSSIGKSISGLTETINGTFASLNLNANVIIKDFSGKIPLGELTQKVQVFEAAANMAKGEILSLKDNLKNTLINKIGDIKELSALRNIDFNVDPQLLPEKLTAEIQTVLGKRLYPLTESVAKAQSEIDTKINSIFE